MNAVEPDTRREQAEAFVRERMETERGELEAKLADALRLEQEVAKEHETAEKAYWAVASKDFDAPITDKENELDHRRTNLYRRLDSITRAVSAHRQALAKLDDPYEFDRRVRAKLEQLQRGRNGDDNNGKGGKVASTKTETKRTPVPDSVLDRIVKLVATKSQQEVADILNKEGLTTASGKPWTPQNIWHAVKKRTGKGVPRKSNAKPKAAAKPKASKPKAKAAKPSANGAKRQAKPMPKSTQAAGTSRGGSGSRKKKTTGKKK